MKEILRVFIYFTLFGIMLIPVFFPIIVKEFTSSILYMFSCLPLSIGYVYLLVRKWDLINSFLSQSVFLEWLIAEDADLLLMIKQKKKIKLGTPGKKICLTFLKSEISSIIEKNEHVRLAANEIQTIATDRVNKSEYIDKAINEGQHHAKLVYRILESACRWKLISGELHVYRGVLGMGAGEYMALWNIIVSRAAALEGATEEQVEDLRQQLRDEISQAG